jgi:hypothetical protein
MNAEVKKNLMKGVTFVTPEEFVEADEEFTKALEEEHQLATQPGLITGKGDGSWGRITVRTDGSILLENVALSNIAIRNCDLVAESGEYPIPFADRANRLDDWATNTPHNTPLHAGHTHDFRPEYGNGTNCVLCGREKK